MATALATFLEAVGTFEDPDLEHEQHRFVQGSVSLVLRRDCHGALRRIEAEFPGEARVHLRERLSALGAWLAVVPGRFDLLDVPSLGRLSLLQERLDVAVRLAPRRERLEELLERVVAA